MSEKAQWVEFYKDFYNYANKFQGGKAESVFETIYSPMVGKAQRAFSSFYAENGFDPTKIIILQHADFERPGYIERINGTDRNDTDGYCLYLPGTANEHNWFYAVCSGEAPGMPISGTHMRDANGDTQTRLFTDLGVDDIIDNFLVRPSNKLRFIQPTDSLGLNHRERLAALQQAAQQEIIQLRMIAIQTY